MRDFQRVSETIRELNAYGIAFSIDDFGTGYSALAWLKKLSLNEIKIDKMFIHDMLLGSGDKIIDTILAIARNTAMRVVFCLKSGKFSNNDFQSGKNKTRDRENPFT